MAKKPYIVLNSSDLLRQRIVSNNFPEKNKISYKVSNLGLDWYGWKSYDKNLPSLPSGTWKNNAKNYKVVLLTKGYCLKAQLKDNNNNWITAKIKFTPGDSFSNINGFFKKD